MNKKWLLCLALLASMGLQAETPSTAEQQKKDVPIVTIKPDATKHPQVQIKTTKGDIVIELFPDKAPISTENFLKYVDEGTYKGTIFHRVIPGFMIQGGGFTTAMSQKKTHAPIVNEAANGLKNDRGTLSMARTNDPNSATAQFFINLVDNSFLNNTNGKKDAADGYAVFGKVVSGMDVVDAIAKTPTATKGPYGDVPKENIEITGATLLD
jgi:peptidyl-prolyl cis-trans isomerase B (cyclophilin B)